MRSAAYGRLIIAEEGEKVGFLALSGLFGLLLIEVTHYTVGLKQKAELLEIQLLCC